MKNKIDINLKFTLLDKKEGKYIATSSGENDVPVALVCDKNICRLLKAVQKVYSLMPSVFLQYIIQNKNKIVMAVHSCMREANSVKDKYPDWAIYPIIGISEYKQISPDVYEVKYFCTGNNTRLMHGFVDEQLFKSLNTIIKDYQRQPLLYYVAMTRYYNRFIKSVIEFSKR